MSAPESEQTPASAASKPTPTTPTTATTRPQRPPDDRGDIPWRLLLFAVVLVYAVLFVILNADQVKVSFVFFSTRVSLVVALVLALLIGFLGGYLFEAARARKSRKKKQS